MLNENDRLTHEHAAGWYSSPYSAGKSRYWTNATKDKLMNRLGEYEDTGLSPEEIRQLIDVVKRLGDINAVAVGDGQFYVNGCGMGDYNAILKDFKKLLTREG